MAILLPLEIQEKKIENSRFRLSQMAAQRAKMLIRGSKPLVETKYEKKITIALQEILEGKVTYYDGEKADKIREELSRRFTEQEKEEIKAIQAKEISQAKAAQKDEEAGA